MRRPLALGLFIALSSAVACGTDDDDGGSNVVTPHVFVGHVAGSEALVALVEDGDSVVGYTCGIGGNLATHTGWYFGVKEAVEGENVQLVNQTNGLRLRGSLGIAGGSGILTLADSREVAFTVEPARGEAGLFDYEDAANFVGFIRANDGATAGNSLVRIGSTESAPSTTSTPVTTTTPTSPTPPRTTTVTFDNGGAPRVVTTFPVIAPENRIIKRTGPVLIFLVHGMADYIGMKKPTDPEDFVECSGPNDKPFYGRCEWGQDFLPGVFGSRLTNAQLTTLDGQDASGDRFLNQPSNRIEFDENLGKTMNGDCYADPNQAERFDPRTAMHFVTPGPLKTPVRVPPEELKLPPPAPQIAAFVTWRDATRGMVFSGRRVTRQIYAAIRWFEATYRRTPGVIVLAQSFGGLASRFMLSKPSPAQLDADTNRENVVLCKEDLAKMDYIRDRTLYLATLATPHEGSQLAEWGPPIKTELQALLVELRAGLSNSAMARVSRALQQIATLLQVQLTPTFIDTLIEGLDDFLPQLDTAAALVDMQLARMEKFNRGPISPDKMRRSAATPIVGGARRLVPVYVTLGRSPGSDAFDTPDVLKGMKIFEKKRAKVRGWITSTMFVSDPITRQFIPKGFGDATVAPYAPFRNILDRRERLFDSSPTTEQLEQKFGDAIRATLGQVHPWFFGKFGRNGEAVLAALQKENLVTLPKVMLPITVDQKWTIGFDGSTIEVPMPVLRCTGAPPIVLNFDAIARLLVDRFGNTPAVLAAIDNMNFRQLLEAASVLIQSSDQFAQQAAAWFVGKVREFQNLPASCDATPDNVFDVFAGAEILNWRVTAGTGRIPVPVWLPTGEAVSDGEMDTDGCVHSASALGFTLAREPFFFEHDRRDDAGQLASWYRIYDNPVTERRNHGLQYENDVGLWFRETFLVPQVGPIPAERTFSVWIE